MVRGALYLTMMLTVLTLMATSAASLGALLPPDDRLVFTEQGSVHSHLIVYAVERRLGVRVVAPTLSAYAPTWSPDGTRLAYYGTFGGQLDIFSIGIDGGGLRRLTATPDLNETHPDLSPDGTRLAYVVGTHDDPPQIYVQPAGDVRDDALLATALSPRQFGMGSPVWSPDGSRIVWWGGTGAHGVYITELASRAVREVTDDAAMDPVWSPDGTLLVYVSSRQRNYELYRIRVDGSAPHNLTQHRANDIAPAWSPDGTRLAFASNRDGGYQIYLLDLTSGGVTRLTSGTLQHFSPEWMPRGGRGG